MKQLRRCLIPEPLLLVDPAEVDIFPLMNIDLRFRHVKTAVVNERNP